MNEDKPRKEIVFNGVTYKLMGSGNYYLSQAKNYKDRKGAQGLHRAIWEYYSNKKIPTGYEIHHIDGNAHNNDFKNLLCVSKKEHIRIHMSQGDWHNSKPTQYALEKAAEWHRSPEGREWHRQSALNRKVTPKDLICLFCGKDFQSDHKDTKFCSYSCNRKFNGRGGKKRYCLMCSKDITMLDMRTKNCSKVCKDNYRRSLS